MLTRRKLIDVKKLLKGEGSDHKTAKDNVISPNTSTCDNDNVSRLRDRDKIKPRKRELPEENLQSASNGKKAKRKKFKKHQPYSHTEEFLKKQASKIKDQIKLVQKWKKMGGKRIQNELKQGSRKRKSTAKTKGKSNNNQKQKERRKEISVKSSAKSKIIRKKNAKKSIENTAPNAKEDNLKSNDNTDVESDDNNLMDVDTENELQKQPFNHTEQALKKKGQLMQERKKIKLIQQQKQKDRKTRLTKANAKSRIIRKYHKYKKPHQPQEPLDLPVYDEMYSEGTQVMFGVFQELALLKTCSVFVQLKYRGTCQYFGTHHAIEEYKTIGLKRKPDDFNIIQHRDGPRLYRGIYYELPNASAEQGADRSQILNKDDETINHDDQHSVKENILVVNNEEVDVKDNQQKSNVVLNESELNMNDNIDISTTDQSKAENKAADNGLNNSYYESTEMSNAYNHESESDEIIGDLQADINDPMGKSVEEIVTEAKNNFSSDNNTAVDDSDYMENDTEESFTEGRTEESLKELIEDSLIKTANEIAKKSYRQKHHRNFSKDKYSQAMASHSHRMKPKSLNSTEPRSCGYTASVLESDIPSIPKSLKFKLQNKGKFVVTQPFSVTEFLKSKEQKSKKEKEKIADQYEENSMQQSSTVFQIEKCKTEDAVSQSEAANPMDMDHNYDLINEKSESDVDIARDMMLEENRRKHDEPIVIEKLGEHETQGPDLNNTDTSVLPSLKQEMKGPVDVVVKVTKDQTTNFMSYDEAMKIPNTKVCYIKGPHQAHNLQVFQYFRNPKNSNLKSAKLKLERAKVQALKEQNPKPPKPKPPKPKVKDYVKECEPFNMLIDDNTNIDIEALNAAQNVINKQTDDNVASTTPSQVSGEHIAEQDISTQAYISTAPGVVNIERESLMSQHAGGPIGSVSLTQEYLDQQGLSIDALIDALEHRVTEDKEVEPGFTKPSLESLVNIPGVTLVYQPDGGIVINMTPTDQQQPNVADTTTINKTDLQRTIDTVVKNSKSKKAKMVEKMKAEQVKVAKVYYKCPICRIPVKRTLLNCHMKSHEDKGETVENYDPGYVIDTEQFKAKKFYTFNQSEQKYECSACQFSAIEEPLIISHNKSHWTSKPYICKSCSMAFTGIHHVRRHIQSTHKEVRPHLCDICSKAFKRLDNLTKHRDLHLIDKRAFPCPACNKAYAAKDYVRSHLRKKHPDFKDHRCGTCKQRFQTYNLRLLHEANCVASTTDNMEPVDPSNIETSVVVEDPPIAVNDDLHTIASESLVVDMNTGSTVVSTEHCSDL